MNKFNILVESVLEEKDKAGFIKNSFKSGSKFVRAIFDLNGASEDEIFDAIENQEYLTADIGEVNKKHKYIELLFTAPMPKDTVYDFAKHIEKHTGATVNNVGTE